MKRASLALLAVLALGAAACSRGEAAPPIRAAPTRLAAAPEAADAPPAAAHAQPAPSVPTASAAPSAAPRPGSAALPRLVFFMNPHGRPCQIQDQILREMLGQLAGRAEVVYVKTTESADLPAFQHFGIRALPTLLVADAEGREIRRAPPGIQSAAQVLQLLAP